MADANGWFALAGALGGGAVGVVTTALTHRWQTRNAEQDRAFEHEQRLRQERRETYAIYWTAWNTLIRTLDHATDGSAEAAARVKIAESEWRQAIDPMFIICGKDVLTAGITHVKVTEARINAALNGTLVDGAGKSRALSRAMRTDLGA